MLPLSGSWIEMFLYVGAGAVLALYGYHVLLSLIKPRRSAKQDAAERAHQLLQQYHARRPSGDDAQEAPINRLPTKPQR